MTAPSTERSRGSGALAGLRVLVVEDSFLVATGLARMVEQMGCDVVGPAPGVAAALALIDSPGCDAAIVDINLGTQSAEPVAERLRAAGIPFLFMTGYASPARLTDRFASARRLRKPPDPAVLRDAMMREFTGGRG
jgi:CheY-like chemotaxis protein